MARRDDSSARALLSRSEREKYRKMWRHSQYADQSHGLALIEEVLKKYVKVSRGEKAYDFGCGDGGVVDFLCNRGIDAIGIDIVAGDSGLLEHPLWDMPEDLEPAPYGFCFDVMQCIPEEVVEASLAGISRLVTKEAWFQIALGEDDLGALIGKKLHVTRKPIGWWRNQLLNHFSGCSMGQPNDTTWLWAHVRK